MTLPSRFHGYGGGEMGPTSERTGVLIIRAWVEAGSSDPLRVQIRIVDDVSTHDERRVALVRPDAVCAAVMEWLEELTAETGQPA